MSLAIPVDHASSSAVTVVGISDPTTVGENIDVIAQDAMQLGSKPLGARQVVVRLGSSLLLYQSTNQPIRTRTVLKDGLVAFVAFGPRAAGTVNGLQIAPERVLASPSGAEVEFVVATGYESASFLLPPDDLRAHLRRRHREDECFVPHGVELLQTTPGAGSRLFDWARRMTAAAAKRPAVFDAPQTRSIAQIELYEVLLSNLGSAVRVELAPRDLIQTSYSQIVQIAEAYALAHASEHLYVTDLCEAAGVSERTLQYAFKSLMGMTPVGYLTRLRLHRVRYALRAASPRSTTVTVEAMKWGFWHFGDFSRAYKDCFGELPSVTLRRTPDATFGPDNGDIQVR